MGSCFPGTSNSFLPRLVSRRLWRETKAKEKDSVVLFRRPRFRSPPCRLSFFLSFSFPLPPPTPLQIANSNLILFSLPLMTCSMLFSPFLNSNGLLNAFSPPNKFRKKLTPLGVAANYRARLSNSASPCPIPTPPVINKSSTTATGRR